MFVSFTKFLLNCSNQRLSFPVYVVPFSCYMSPQCMLKLQVAWHCFCAVRALSGAPRCQFHDVLFFCVRLWLYVIFFHLSGAIATCLFLHRPLCLALRFSFCVNTHVKPLEPARTSTRKHKDERTASCGQPIVVFTVLRAPSPPRMRHMFEASLFCGRPPEGAERRGAGRHLLGGAAGRSLVWVTYSTAGGESCLTDSSGWCDRWNMRLLDIPFLCRHELATPSVPRYSTQPDGERGAHAQADR